MDLSKWNVSFKPLVWGFCLSLLLTFAAYVLAVKRVFFGPILFAAVLGLGSLQALIQFVLFLHVGIESKPRWNLLMFFFMVLVVFLIIGGSLWIMETLNYNLMPPMNLSQ